MIGYAGAGDLFTVALLVLVIIPGLLLAILYGSTHVDRERVEDADARHAEEARH